MKMQDVINIIILVALGVCLYLLLTRKGSNVENHLHQTIEYDSSSTIVQPYTKIETTKWLRDTIQVKVPQDVDTAAILRDYYTKKVSVQEYRDTSLYATINDTIFMNGIYSRAFEYKILRPTTHVEVLPVPRIQIFAGVTISQHMTGVNATALIGGKYSVTAGYDLRQKTPYFGGAIKINPLKIK